MTERMIGPYRVLDKLGEGGMGEVYRAHDSRLGRDLAIKVLPAAMASDPDMRERFGREARAIAALNHPNIVTIYSVEDADGVRFLTMELVEGEALDRLIPSGGLDIDRVISIGEAVADALAAAHDRGIIHRDLKPANVMVTKDGRVKVLDFGLAKVHGPDAGDGTRAELPTAMVTAAGMVMGTRPYMSPEQVQGRALDRRTDIFSLGVMLYEMTTGRRPFQGQSPAELFASILRDPAPLASDLRADLPSDLARVIQRCLEKDPNDRMQTARDAGHALRDSTRSARASSEQPRPSSGRTRADEGFWVAVLPFKYSGPDAALTTLAEGLSEEIVTGLSRFSYLRVIARSSTSQYGDQAVDVRTVGQQLGARYVMEGSLRQAGASLRVAVQVVDATSGAHLWAETYNRAFDPAEIFTLQDDLVPRIVSTVADWYGVLPHSMSEAVRSRPIDQLSPYEALLRAFGYYERVTPEEHAVARPVLERAVKEAPGHGAAWAMLSMLYGEEHRFEFNVEPDPLGRALLAARRAVETAPSSHVSYLALAQAHYFRKEFEAFRSAAERAVAQNPLDGATLEYLGHLLAFSGNWERGRELGDRARQLNANHPSWYWALPLLDAYRVGDYQVARALAPKAQMPGQYYSHGLIAAVYGQAGDLETAREEVRQVLTLRPDFAEIAREQFGRWYLPDLVEQLIDGLRKAGLDVPPAG
jgi:serine/threonine protein kinase/tetratricopeptide (TPR) repeat protein